MSLNPLAIHLHLRILLLNLIIVKLPASLREQLKIPLGLLLPIGQDNKENIQKQLSNNSYIITVGDKTTEKMIEYRDKALTILHSFPNSSCRDALEELVRYTTDRKF